MHRFCSRKLKETEFCYKLKTSKMQRRHYKELVSYLLSKTTAVTSVFDGVNISVGFLLHPSHVRDLPQLILILPVVHMSEQKFKGTVKLFYSFTLLSPLKVQFRPPKTCIVFAIASNSVKIKLIYVYHNHDSKKREK